MDNVISCQLEYLILILDSNELMLHGSIVQM